MVATKKSSSKSTVSKAKTGAAKKSKKGSKAAMPSTDRIVLAIASRHGLGEEKPSRDMVMGLALITNKKSFNTTLLNIRKKEGWIEYDKDTVWLTEEGRNYVGPNAVAVPQTNDAMQARLREDMVKGLKPRQIFDIMLDGRWYTREELADAMGIPNNKSFGTYVSSLRKVVVRDGKKIRLSDICFPCGRP